MVKKVLSTVLAVLLLFSFGSPVYAAPAAQQNDALPAGQVGILWVYILSAGNALSIDSSGLAHMESQIQAYDPVNSVRMVNYLQRLESGSWRTVNSWAQTYSGQDASWDGYYYVVSGYYYRLYTIFYAYEDGVCIETATKITSAVWH